MPFLIFAIEIVDVDEVDMYAGGKVDGSQSDVCSMYLAGYSSSWFW